MAIKSINKSSLLRLTSYAKATARGFSTSIFFEGRNLLDTNFETGGILAENEVDGTGGGRTFVTPGQPLTVFGGMKFTW